MSATPVKATVKIAPNNPVFDLPTITGRSKTGLFGAILTVALTGVADIGSSFVLNVMPRAVLRPTLKANVVPEAGGCKPAWQAWQVGRRRGAQIRYAAALIDERNAQRVK